MILTLHPALETVVENEFSRLIQNRLRNSGFEDKADRLVMYYSLRTNRYCLGLWGNKDRREVMWEVRSWGSQAEFTAGEVTAVMYLLTSCRIEAAKKSAYALSLKDKHSHKEWADECEAATDRRKRWVKRKGEDAPLAVHGAYVPEGF